VNKFWKFDAISEKQFLEEVETGDVILFRGNKSNHSLIRGITGGHFDHAAIIIKDSNDPHDDVTFLEACSDTGVASSSWQRIRGSIGPGKFFEKICVRKVKTKRT